MARSFERHHDVVLRASRAGWVAAGAAAAAWVALVLHEVVGVPHAHGAGVPFSGSIRGWPLMVAAMMGPGLVPAVRHVVQSSLPWRRARAATELVVTFTVLWLAFGVVAVAVAAALPPSAALAPLALVAAALWQLTPAKRRSLRACHRGVPLPPTGWRATAGCVRFGVVQGRACVGTCWCLMAFMALTPGSHAVWSPVLAGVALAERNAARPAAATRRIAVVLVALAAVAAVTAP